jgi:hypothetical protein
MNTKVVDHLHICPMNFYLPFFVYVIAYSTQVSSKAPFWRFRAGIVEKLLIVSW